MDKDLNPLEGAPADRDRGPSGNPPAPPASGTNPHQANWWQPRPAAGAPVGGAPVGPSAEAPSGQQIPPRYPAGGAGGYPTGGGPSYGQAWTNPYPTMSAPVGSGPVGSGPVGTATAEARRPANRGRRTTMVVAGTVIFALAAGFGAGALGARVTSDSSASAASHTLTQLASVTTSKAAAADGSVEQVAATLLPSVVSVLSSSSGSSGEGSGIILSSDGMILTNNHVISGATSLGVQFNDGTTAEATVVGADSTDDLAVIKATGVSGLTTATLGSSADLQIGQGVIAVGSPLGLSATVTSGIVSALNRPVRTSSAEDQQQQQQQQQLPGRSQQQSQTSTNQDTVMNAIQTDAAINPGNSGGPLVDMSGHVIGINSAIASLSSSSSSEGGSIGVGFAIPIDQAKRIAQEIIDTGKATHAVLGASVGDATDGNNSLLTVGAKIADITAGSGAANAGLQTGDVITKVGDQHVDSADALIAAVRSAAPNSQVGITYTRGTTSDTVTVTLGSATAN